MARALRLPAALLFAAQRATAFHMSAGQPTLFLPPKEPELSDPDCPFYEKCGEDCLGTTFQRKQMSPEVKQRLQALDGDHKVIVSFALLSDVSADVALACKLNMTVHLFDPRPNAPEHMQFLRKVVGTMEATHPVTSPVHEGCEDCPSYWDDVSHSKALSDQFVHHYRAVGPSDGANITLYEDRAENWKMDPRKARPGGANVTLPALSVASALREEGIPRPDVVRIDADGLEHSLLEQVATLPEEMRPQIIFAELPSFYEWTCRGEFDECKVWKKEAKALVSRVMKMGWSAQLYHKMDFIFMWDGEKAQ